jgi:hypothetical protein
MTHHARAPIPSFPPPRLLAAPPSAAQAGRFAQTFLLNALPSGGMFVKVDICRWSPGAAKTCVAADPTGLGAGFVQSYYEKFAAARESLGGVYNDKSQLSFEGQACVGQAAIAAKLPALPQGAREYDSLDAVQALDAPAAPGAPGPAALALVTGKVRIAGEANALMFVQVFLLVVENGAPYCASDIFNFNYA